MKVQSTALLFASLLAVAGGCKKKLEENPKTVFTTAYYKTPAGLQAAVVAIYSGMRFNYGPNGALAITNVGTDEFTYGDQPRTGQDNDVLRLGTYNLATTDGSILTPWNRSYSNINLANMVVEYAPDVTMDENAKKVLVAEARYLRAHYYMILVSQFGAVPIDLGGGDLKFNTTPYQGFNRLPADQLLVKNYQAIIDDLLFAADNLPNQRPANQFKLFKGAALHLLAKAYLYRAYSAAKQPTDFKSAWDAAKKLIDGAGTYNVGLLQNYADVHRQGNDYNMEVLYSVERSPLDNNTNEVPNPGSDFSGKVNIANNMFNADYTSTIPANYFNPALANKKVITTRPLQYGRPLRRYAPTKWLLDTAFADKINDSRFDNSFRIMWQVATVDAQGTAAYNTYVNDMAALGLAIGDTAIYLARTVAEYTALRNASPAKRYWLVSPTEFYTNQNTALNIFPNLKKYDDNQRASFNDVSGRPFIVSKLSETYLIAAEAAIQDGRPGDAVPLINTLRDRAAFRAGLSGAELANRRAALQVNAGMMNLDFILDERTRELCGESVRWPDLAVRGVLLDRVKKHNVDGAPNIKPTHVLRPIPQSQLDNISDPDKTKYQNPGY